MRRRKIKTFAGEGLIAVPAAQNGNISTIRATYWEDCTAEAWSRRQRRIQCVRRLSFACFTLFVAWFAFWWSR